MILSLDAWIIHSLLCWAYNQFLMSHLHSNRLPSNTKYSIFLTGFLQSKRICISNYCVCCYDNTQPDLFSAAVCNILSLKASHTCNSGGLEKRWFCSHTLPSALSHHIQRWKRFLATLMQCMKHKECTKAYNKRGSPSREAEHLCFLPHPSLQ